MKIILSGGGSGGHITPVLAVARELRRQKPQAKIIYVGENNGKFLDLVKSNKDIDQVYTIPAGKFRRYHGESWGKRILDVRTNLLNLRDFFLFVAGIARSYLLLGKVKPDVVFLKGGFVGVPVGYASAMRHVPFVTHDSDATAGLANRLVSKWAVCHATALPEDFYMYPRDKTRYVGVLVNDEFQAITPELQSSYKAELGIASSSPMLLVTGGSLGAKRLNRAFADIAPELLDRFKNLTIIHQVGKSGRDTYQNFSDKRLIVMPFLDAMHRYTGGADLVVARAGANTLAELGVQGKAVIVVPNAQLAGGHQTKNAQKLAKEKAVVVVDETSQAKTSRALQKSIISLLADTKKRHQLGQNLQQISPTGGARKLVMLLLEVSSRHRLPAPAKQKSKKN